ncbi:MAG: zf-HC2 domain-containing protein [Planctomycetes bacterium]|nr:zf-HC2 domain-containing protein [Planctomycetota bacterium]
MDCDRFRELLPELLARDLTADDAVAAERHARGCTVCASELVQHRRTWELLGVLEEEHPMAPARLDRMAATALARAGEPEEGVAPVATMEVLALSRWRSPWTRVAAAAVLVASTAFVTRWWIRREVLPEFLDDAEFVIHFELLRDLSDLDGQGELLDLDDELIALDALRGA